MAKNTVRRMRDFENDIRDLWSRAKCFQLTHEQILAERTERIYGHKHYARLTRWEDGFLRGVWECLSHAHYANLVWTHVLDGVRVESKTFPDSRLRDIDPDQSRHAYRVQGGGFKVYFEPIAD